MEEKSSTGLCPFGLGMLPIPQLDFSESRKIE